MEALDTAIVQANAFRRQIGPVTLTPLAAVLIHLFVGIGRGVPGDRAACLAFVELHRQCHNTLRTQ